MAQRIPVYLLTGYLGSGKTSLLKHWLRQAPFKNAALIINELGEIGLDNQLLSAAVEPQSGATLIANSCVCCTGLPGLAEALENLFWARLERRIPKFDCVVIETTGLALASPIIETMATNELLSERFELNGIITCLSAGSANAVLASFEEAQDQLQRANVVILTKIDLIPPSELDSAVSSIEKQLRQKNTSATVLLSSNSNVYLQDLLAAIRPPNSRQTTSYRHQNHGHSHDHQMQAYWWPIKQQVDEKELLLSLDQMTAALGTQLSRIKGIVNTSYGNRLIEISPFDKQISISFIELNPSPEFGLTIISSEKPNFKNYS
jgi:G3E family GTPase